MAEDAGLPGNVKLDRKTIEKLLEDDEARGASASRAGTSCSAARRPRVKKLDALLAARRRRRPHPRRLPLSWRSHRPLGRGGFSTAKSQAHHVEDLDAAIAAVATGDYAHVKSCTRSRCPSSAIASGR